MKLFWRWLPWHKHEERPLFGGGLLDFGATYCDKCGQFRIFMTETLMTLPVPHAKPKTIRMFFTGYGKAIKHRLEVEEKGDGE